MTKQLEHDIVVTGSGCEMQSGNSCICGQIYICCMFAKEKFDEIIQIVQTAVMQQSESATTKQI
jgi:hypothetical protein